MAVGGFEDLCVSVRGRRRGRLRPSCLLPTGMASPALRRRDGFLKRPRPRQRPRRRWDWSAPARAWLRPLAAPVVWDPHGANMRARRHLARRTAESCFAPIFLGNSKPLMLLCRCHRSRPDPPRWNRHASAPCGVARRLARHRANEGGLMRRERRLLWPCEDGYNKRTEERAQLLP